jgi:hypothetical protein
MTPTFWYTMYIMKNQEETNMKESNLIEKVEVLCKELTESLHAAYKHTANDYYDFSVGKKYIKIISNGSQRSVWGFINISEFVKERKMTNEIKKVC